MLADEIIAFPDSKEFVGIASPIQNGYRRLAADTAKAQRFVLTRDAVFLMHSVCNIPPSRILPALQICRMPFPVMWVELVHRDRDDWYAMANVNVNKADYASSPSRLGFYLEQIDETGRKIEVSLAWRHNADSMNLVMSGYSMIIDTSEHVTVSNELRAARAQALANPDELQKKFNLVAEYPIEADNGAALELEARITLHLSRYMTPMWDFVRQHHPQQLEQLRENATFDMLAEWRFITGFLTVLNSRNLVEYSPPITYEKINKARNRKGIPPLRDHREIRVSLSLVQRNRLGRGNSAHDLHAHLVRGHFKIRKTGLFWWSPHVRGTIGDAPNIPYYVR